MKNVGWAMTAALRIEIPAPCSLSREGITREPAARNRATVDAAVSQLDVRNWAIARISTPT